MRHRFYRCHFINEAFDADSAVVSNAEKVVYDLKSVWSFWKVDCRQVRKAFVLSEVE